MRSSRATFVSPWHSLDNLVVAIPATFALWNPWGLVGRHEIRLLFASVALALCLRSLARRQTIRIPRGWQWGVAFVVMVGASALFARDWRTTLIGHADRHLGLIGWLLLAAALLVGANLTVVAAANLRLALEAAAVIVAIGSIGQLLAPDVFGHLGPANRPTSTFGSATYTGAALSLALPFLLDRCFSASVKSKRLLAFAAAMVVGLALISTGSRGAWMGGVVGLVAIGWAHRRQHARAVLSLAAISFGTVAVAVLSSAAVRERLTSIGRPNSGTAGGRFVLWESAVRAIAARPVLGWGPDRTRVGLPPSLPRSFEAEYSDQTIPDRVHNALLDVAITVGVPAALLLLTVGALLVLAAVGSVRAGVGPVWLIAAIAHIPHLVFNFVQLDLDLTAALVVGVAAGGAARSWAPLTVARSAISVTASASAVVFALFCGGLVLADVYAARAVRSERAGDAAGAERSLDSAVSFSFGDARYYEIVARYERRSGDLVAGIAAADAAAARHREDPFFGELPALTRAEATRLDFAYGVEALDLYGDLIDHWPNRGSYFTGTGVAEALLGRPEDAERSFLTALELTPLNHWPYLNLAQLYEQLGDTEAARSVLRSGVPVVDDPEPLRALLEDLS